MKKRSIFVGAFCMSFLAAGCNYPFSDKYPQFLKDLLNIEEVPENVEDENETWSEITVAQFYDFGTRAEKNPNNVAYATGKLKDAGGYELTLDNDRFVYDDIEDKWVCSIGDENRATKVTMDFLEVSDKLGEVKTYMEQGSEALGFDVKISRSNKDNFVVEWSSTNPEKPDETYHMAYELNKYLCITKFSGVEGDAGGVIVFEWKHEEIILDYTVVSLSEVVNAYRNASKASYNRLDVYEEITSGAATEGTYYHNLSYDAEKDQWSKQTDDKHIDIYHLTDSKIEILNALPSGEVQCRKTKSGTYRIIVKNSSYKEYIELDDFFYFTTYSYEDLTKEVTTKVKMIYTWNTVDRN